MNLSIYETKRLTENRLVAKGEGGYGGVGLGIQGYQMQTITYRMDKKQVLLYNTRNYITQGTKIIHNEKACKKYVCITESLCYTAEINLL